ncbi:predicted protein [Aspergillus terreus NIH2624]|uniref:Uncharacterized protein n=1 Tax=Aspergillus terreus (strain NIH 2624 / FGSC A1156) TaxID=341663 RepID=Q0C7V5_ASPTN|nr:uncharacterized protein ATEG_10229 [Aspergillus terreus NIH2624]EAU29226.1 predicted protein [Aspergillus terreus NIH2624]
MDYIHLGGQNLSRSFLWSVIRDAGDNTHKSYILPNPPEEGDTQADKISKGLIRQYFEEAKNFIKENFTPHDCHRESVLLYQCSAGKFDIKVKLGGIYFQDGNDCVVTIQVELSSSDPGLRCAFLKLECEVDQDVTGSQIIKDIKPAWSRGEVKTTKRSQTVEYRIQEKKTGATLGGSHTTEANLERRLTINGFIKCIKGKEKLARWTLNESGADANGIPPGFQGAFVLGSRRPFRLTVKVCVNLFGSIKYWWFTPHRGAKAGFDIDPELLKCDRKVQLEKWTGAMGEYTFYPYPP